MTNLDDTTRNLTDAERRAVSDKHIAVLGLLSIETASDAEAMRQMAAATLDRLDIRR